MRFPCVHAAATTPVQQLGVIFALFTQPYQPSPIPLSGRPAHRFFRGLLGVHSRCGLHTRTVTKSRPLSRGFRHFVTSMPAPVASGWSGSPGGTCTHWKTPPCHGARDLQPSQIAFSGSSLAKISAGIAKPRPSAAFMCITDLNLFGRSSRRSAGPAARDRRTVHRWQQGLQCLSRRPAQANSRCPIFNCVYKGLSLADRI